MENGDINKEVNKTNGKNNKVHITLAHSYFVYFILLIIGIFLDLFFHINLFIPTQVGFIIGIFFILLSSIIIFWAQKSTRVLYSKDIISKENFHTGPYKYTRMPTHFGLLFLILGFGFIMNAFFVIIFTLISFIITKIFFVKKQEDLLETEYGDHYKEYKKKVKF